MNTFQKRDTKRELRILEKIYSVDFGRDDITFILKKVQAELEKIQEKAKDNSNDVTCFEIIKKEKSVLKEAIGEFLGSPGEVVSLFESDDTIILHRDIYTFLVEEYMKVLQTKSPYDAERIERV
ncbi:hypothetical protein [Anaerotignum sp.]|uniref:hypothetical protein n=1 Tax=Anaerotignum sp. TaxID=2039241 RepID=UPI002714E757|nr:hypothetical protein [Anaerotignum sp.]